MPGCVVVAQRTLDPLAQVRILARQPINIKTKTNGLKLLDNGFWHSECSEELGPCNIAQNGRIDNLDAEN